jgi:lipid II:glycine glycyltransferase (peptidoglycan interpeptide bridge formation enzyme)
MGTNRGSAEASSTEYRVPSTEKAQGVEHQVAGTRYFIAQQGRPADWDPVISEQDGSLLQSWRWGEFKKVSGWSPVRLGISSPSGPLIFGQVLYRSVPRLPFPVSIGYLPRGPVYFPGAESDKEAEEAFWRAIHQESRRRGAIFLKVEPNVALDEAVPKSAVNDRMAAFGLHPAARLQPARTWALDIDRSEDDLLKGMKPKTRYNLRLAGKRGVSVRRATSLADLKAFHSLLEITGKRDQFGIHTFPYYEQLWSLFGPEGDNSMTVLLAGHPGGAERAAGPIAGLLAFRFGREAVYMYGASDNRGREHMPNYLLQWEAIRWAREHGCALYDFWGIPDPPAEDGEEGKEGAEVSPINARSGLRGVYWFKRGFGGREIEYPGAYDYIYNPWLYKLWMRWRGADLG